MWTWIYTLLSSWDTHDGSDLQLWVSELGDSEVASQPAVFVAIFYHIHRKWKGNLTVHVLFRLALFSFQSMLTAKPPRSATQGLIYLSKQRPPREAVISLRSDWVTRTLRYLLSWIGWSTDWGFLFWCLVLWLLGKSLSVKCHCFFPSFHAKSLRGEVLC